jgi:hypothetical protein
MKRFVGAAFLASLVAVAAQGCDDSSSGNWGGGAGGDCSAYTSCGSCTPVAGCGWCFNETGGICASDPDTCAGVSEFTWTWEPSGCPDVDASVTAPEGGSANAAPDAGAAQEAATTPAEASTGPTPEASVADTGSANREPVEASTPGN